MATQQCTATLTYDNGDSDDVTESADWSSSDTDVATVDSDGLVTSQGEGTCEITAEHSGLTGTADVVVTEPGSEPEALAISPSEISLEHTDESEDEGEGGDDE